MTRAGESQLGRAYRRIYEILCGKHPNLRLWHFQFLDAFYLYRSLRRHLSELGGRVLDVGCGEQPYRNWLGRVDEYIGIDIAPGPRVDHVIDKNSVWPIPDQSIDLVLCTQVLEHVDDLNHTLNEIRRVLRTGGKAVISVPFIYNEHGAPGDFRRFSAYGAEALFPDWTALLIDRQGGIGSTLMILLLNWIESLLNKRFVTRLLKAILLPIWIMVSFLCNVFGLLLDILDGTSAFYNNVLVIFEKKDPILSQQDNDNCCRKKLGHSK